MDTSEWNHCFRYGFSVRGKDTAVLSPSPPEVLSFFVAVFLIHQFNDLRYGVAV